MNITSAAGVVALLDEPVQELVIFALRKLNTIVDEFWPEVSEVIEKLEILTEDKKFSHRELASLLASKVHYHLCSYEDSLMYALGAGDLFQVNSNSEYVQTMISKAIDVYTAKRIKVSEGKDGEEVDPRLEAVVNRMFERCFQHRQYKQALGVALETRRMDIFEQAILKSDDIGSMLAYAFKVTMTFIQNRQFRNEILRYLVKLYKNLRTPDYLNMCQCLIFLDDAMSVSEMLVKLSGGDEDSRCLSYQIAFDLYESATQQFLSRVLEGISSSAPLPLGAQSTKPEEDTSEAMQVDNEGGEEKKEKEEPPSKASLSEDDKACQERLEKLSLILRGGVSIDSHLQFQIRSNHTDMLILKHTKEAVRVSACHNATVIANGFMHSGTTSDQFLRDNLDWLSRATNWAKFTATASLGVIHRGHEKEALSLMQAYLPRDSSGSGSGYAEGGSLYALGLIHANHGEAILKYLLQQLNDAQNEMVRHGGCLGLGLAAMSTHREDLYEQLRFNLYQDDAVAGEAAGIAMGLVMLGSKCPKAIEDMVAYAQETQHEKILRGLAVGISLIMYGRLEEADALITSLCQDKDPVLRRSGMYTVAMAYAGTGNNEAIRKLLHVAVSDVNDDVRRAAVEAIGFLLFRTPEQCPSLVSLLSESYNPHVRYGAAMALGIACAGTGLKEAIGLLEPMTNDPVNYVRQGALISSALVMIQQTESTCPKVKDFRTLYAKVISDKHEDVMAKFGAILAQGILDAGGRNVTISLQSRTGHTNMTSVVGLLVFSQFWYWYPLSHFLSLAFTPTAIIGLNSDLKMPKVQFKSSAKPSMFAYPAPLEEKKKEEREKVTTAVLSITAKAKKKEDAKKKEEKMEVDEEEKPEKEKGDKDKTEKEKAEKEKAEKTKTEKDKSEKEKTEKEKPEKEKAEKEKPEKEKSEKEKAEKDKGDKDKEKDKEKKKEEKKDEPNFELLDNPARVVRPQLRLMSMEGNSWVPLRPLNGGGIIVLKPTDPSKPVQLVEPVLPVGSQQGKQEDEQEPEPPQPFLYVED